MEETLFCFGYGYSAAALARRLRGRGWRVGATARASDKAEALHGQGIDAHVWPLESLDTIPDGAAVLISAGPSDGRDPVLAQHADALKSKRLGWVGYLSTTSVYGDHAGGWVDETTPVGPESARGADRVRAEADWLALAEHDLPVHVFRLAGIYGPGRGPFEKVRRGTAQRIVKEGQVFGRIHVEDIASVLALSIERPAPGTIYNVTDDFPAPPQDVIAYAASLLGVAPPPEVAFADADLSPMARSFYGESKRVSNARIKAELGVALAYPTYREGLDAVLEAERGDAP